MEEKEMPLFKNEKKKKTKTRKMPIKYRHTQSAGKLSMDCASQTDRQTNTQAEKKILTAFDLSSRSGGLCQLCGQRGSMERIEQSLKRGAKAIHRDTPPSPNSPKQQLR